MIELIKSENSDNDYLLEFLRQFYRENGKIPVVKDFNKNSKYPNYNVYVRRFGSWNNAIRMSGFIPNKYLSEEELLEYIREFHKKNGRTPTPSDFINNPNYPKNNMYYKKFGDWEKVLTKAGIIKQQDIDMVEQQDITEQRRNIVIQQSPVYDKLFIEYKKIMSTFNNIPFFDNPYTGQHMSEYIKGYVMQIFDAKRIFYDNKNRYVDFIINWNNEILKIKCLVSSLNYSHNAKKRFPHYYFNINNNNNVDAFILVGVKDRLSLEPQYLWFIKSNELFITESASRGLWTIHRELKSIVREFWDRSELTIYKSGSVLHHMSKYEIKMKLEQLKDVVKSEYHKLENMDNNIYMLLVKKQKEIYIRTGKKREIGHIVEDAIKLELQNDIYNTVDIYNSIVERQKSLDIMGDKKDIKEIIEEIIKSGLKYVTY